MLSFNQVCQELQQEELASFRDIECNISRNFYPSSQLQEKIDTLYEIFWWKKPKKPNEFSPRPIVVGCCEIGKLSGCEVMWLFSRIFKNDDLCKYGTCLCLSINKLPIAAILFFGSDHYPLFPHFVTPKTSQREEDRSMYSKLFNDDEVEKRRLGKNQASASYYTLEKINHLRSKANSEYFKILKTQLAEFPQIPFRDAFMGLMFECVFKGSAKNPVKTKEIDPTLLPFAACVKFAFD